MRKKLFSFLLALVYFTAPAQSRTEKLEAAYKQLTEDSQARYAITSLCVLDAKTGKTLFARNENTGLAPASTLKTITAATAFSMLGKEFTYKTTLFYTGSIDPAGTLNGDLLIRGSGDPTLGSWRYAQTKEGFILNQWVNAIKKAGIKKINGRIIGDGGAVTQSTPEGWIWQDMGNYYGAGATGLNWRENQFDIKLRPGKSVESAVQIVRFVPPMPYLTITNELETGASGTGDNAYAFIAPYATAGYLRGKWGLNISKDGISASTPDPAFDVAYRLQDTLKGLGIHIAQTATTTRILSLENKTAGTGKELISTSSPPLSDIIYWFCKKSVNLYGEALIKTLAEKTGKAATTRNGAQTVIKFWADKGIDANALNIIDGSGLSPGTRITTAAMASILFQAQKEAWFEDYLKTFPDNNGMKLKSGSINDVSAYAGYFNDNRGNQYVIVININNYNGGGISKKLFKVLDALK